MQRDTLRPRLRIGIVTPANRAANNGNWHTAWRWSRLLRERHDATILGAWDGEPLDLLLALHARRSAGSVAAWHAAGRGPLGVVLTGTDLYRDIASDPDAQASLRRAHRLIVLQELAPRRVPAEYRERTRVCFQSCGRRRPMAKTGVRLRALMVGHLREEKAPRTYFEAARLLAGRDDIVLEHVGAPLDAALGDEAAALAASHPNYRWLGALPHGETRERIQRAHVLVHASRMEGGAHVIAEAVMSGTPVIASRIDGNLGMLGEGYGGCFDLDDAAGLATLLQQARDDRAMLPALAAQCREREPLFEPQRERDTLLAVIDELAAIEPWRTARR